MNRRHAFVQLILARVREFYREPHAIFWVYGFPLILAILLGIAFKSTAPTPPIVDVQGSPGDKRSETIVAALTNAKVAVSLHSPAQCLVRFKAGKTDLIVVVQPETLEYKYDPAREKSVLARYWVDSILARAASPTEALAARDILLSEPGTRYIDFLLPGLIGINIMGGGLFGVGFVLVDMRVRKLFKRFMATPMHRGDFLLSLITARMLFLMPEMLALLAVGWLAFGVPINGSLLTLLLVILVGTFAFAGIGLLVGARTETLETISGLINLVMLSMYLFSGVFFSSTRFPDFLQPLVQALPLTHLIDALRAVMLDGAGLGEVAGQLGILASWAVVTFTLALRWFRWR